MKKIFYGNDKLIIEKEVKQLLSDNQYLYFDFEKDYLSILNMINQNTLFSDQNINIIIDNCYFLKSNDLLIQQQNLINQINNDNDKNIYLIVECNKLASQINRYFFNIEKIYFAELTQWTKDSYIKKLLKEKKIFLSNEDFDKLKNKLLPNYGIIENEINKLVYFNKNEISQHINLIITDYCNDNIFDLCYFFLKKNYKKTFHLLNKLININYSPEQIINILINQLLKYKIYLLYFLKENNDNKFKLTFNMTNFVFNKVKDVIKNLDLKSLNKNVNLLYNIDRFCKLGYLKSSYALLYFLIGEDNE